MFLRFHTSLQAWLPIMGLTICAFIFNTTEFAPISLLTTIATDFNISEAQTGMMMTIYAWIVATISLPLMLLTKNVERKSLLLGILFFFILSHLLSAFAWSYAILMLSRIGIAFSHAIFWAITASLVYRLAPKGQTTKALSFLATGSSLAIVLGLPIGRIIGQAWGWRSTFGVIALLGVGMFYFLYKTLPILPSQNTGSLKSLPILMKRPALMGMYLLTILAISAHFTAYSYIEPFVIHVAHLGEHFATAVLFLFGIAGLLGSMLFARLRHKHPFGLVLFALSALIFAEGFMLMLSFHVVPFSILSLFWGIAICLISLILQVSVLELAPDATDVAMSLYSGIYNIGIGGGAFIGGWVINSLGMHSIGYVGALFGALALALAIWIWKRYLVIQK